MPLSSRNSRPIPVMSIKVIAAILLLFSTLSHATTSDLIRSHHQHSSDLAKRLVGEARLHIDTGMPPPMRSLDKRKVGGEDGDSNEDAESTTSTKSSRPTSTSASATGEGSATPTSTNSSSDDDNDSTPSSTSSSAAPSYTAKSLPQAFDTSIGNNFTTTACPNFIQSFLANSTFQSCAPVSLLLQNSLSFFQAVRSPPVLKQTLDKSCAASLAVCSPLMSSIASNLISEDNCGDDFKRQNAIVTQAYAGLMAYEPVYKASCLKDNATDEYCFWEAYTNANNNTNAASDSYPYFTAIGVDLPPTSTPLCTDCLKETMSIFAGYARMKGQPLAGTYLDAAKHLNTGCGSDFADATVQVAVQANINSATNIGTNNFLIAALVAIISSLLLM